MESRLWRITEDYFSFMHYQGPLIFCDPLHLKTASIRVAHPGLDRLPASVHNMLHLKVHGTTAHPAMMLPSRRLAEMCT